MDANKVVNNMIGSHRKRGGKNDLDGDGVPNKKDCQPRNIIRQDMTDYELTNLAESRLRPSELRATLTEKEYSRLKKLKLVGRRNLYTGIDVI